MAVFCTFYYCRFLPQMLKADPDFLFRYEERKRSSIVKKRIPLVIHNNETLNLPLLIDY